MFRIFASAGALLAALAPCPAAADFAGAADAVVERVIDGDTVKMRVAIWIDQEIIVSVRLAEVDAPELFRPACAAERRLAQEATAFTQSFLAAGSARLSGIHYGKYAGRIVAHIEANGADLGDALIEAGLAARGGADWCAMS